jgi:PAS domain S-box-containing protein
MSFLDGTSQISMIATDLDGNFKLWNKGSEEIFGYKISEVLGKTPAMLHDPEDLRIF